jgi:hypothetical protein
MNLKDLIKMVPSRLILHYALNDDLIVFVSKIGQKFLPNIPTCAKVYVMFKLYVASDLLNPKGQRIENKNGMERSLIAK